MNQFHSLRMIQEFTWHDLAFRTTTSWKTLTWTPKPTMVIATCHPFFLEMVILHCCIGNYYLGLHVLFFTLSVPTLFCAFNPFCGFSATFFCGFSANPLLRLQCHPLLRLQCHPLLRLQCHPFLNGFSATPAASVPPLRLQCHPFLNGFSATPAASVPPLRLQCQLCGFSATLFCGFNATPAASVPPSFAASVPPLRLQCHPCGFSATLSCGFSATLSCGFSATFFCGFSATPAASVPPSLAASVPPLRLQCHPLFLSEYGWLCAGSKNPSMTMKSRFLPQCREYPKRFSLVKLLAIPNGVLSR